MGGRAGRLCYRPITYGATRFDFNLNPSLHPQARCRDELKKKKATRAAAVAATAEPSLFEQLLRTLLEQPFDNRVSNSRFTTQPFHNRVCLHNSVCLHDRVCLHNSVCLHRVCLLRRPILHTHVHSLTLSHECTRMQRVQRKKR